MTYFKTFMINRLFFFPIPTVFNRKLDLPFGLEQNIHSTQNQRNKRCASLEYLTELSRPKSVMYFEYNPFELFKNDLTIRENSLEKRYRSVILAQKIKHKNSM